MSLHQEELSQILFLCGDECVGALVFKAHLAHLKVCIDLIYPAISDDHAYIEETDVNVSLSQRALDTFETLHNLLCECVSEEATMKLLDNYADNSATICHAYYTIIDLANAYSINVKLDLLVNRWALFRIQLTDWKGALGLLGVFSENLRNDPRHSKADIAKVDKLRKKIIIQFPEPDLFHRIKSIDIFPFHSFNESRTAEEGEDSSNACMPAGDTGFAIFSTGGGGIPVACKTISAVNLKNGSRSLKEVADLYLLTDTTSSPYVQSLLKICFLDQDEGVNMIYPLAPLGNLKTMLTTYQKARKRTAGEPGSHEVWLSEHRRAEGKLSVMSDILGGLTHLHSKGVVHGRLKPSNVLIFDNYRARICDFGISPLLKVGAKTAAWLQAGKAALATSITPPDSASVPFQELNIGEGGVRWLAPELLLIPKSIKALTTTATATATISSAPSSGDEEGDVTRPRYAADKYAVAMVMYYIITEKAPFFNIIWNEGVYNVLISGDRPSFDTFIPDCQEEELFAPLYDDIECAWASDPKSRKLLADMGESVNQVHQELFYSIESRILDQMTEKLEEIKIKPDELKAAIAKNAITIAKGEEALRRKQVELDNALNGKQRKEFTAQLEKGRARLDSFITDTNVLKTNMTSAEAELKATKKIVKAQTEKRYGGMEHILRHRVAHRECTALEHLIKMYKGSSSKGDIDDALASANACAVGVGGGSAASNSHALQSFFFKSGDRSHSLADEQAEYLNNCEGGEECALIDEELTALCTFACSTFEEGSISEVDIPRFAKFGSLLPVSNSSSAGGVFTAPPLTRARADSDLRSEKSDKSDKSSISRGGSGVAVTTATTAGDIAFSAGGAVWKHNKHLEGGSSVSGSVHTDDDPSGDFWKFDAGHVSTTAASATATGPSDGFVSIALNTIQLQYLAAYRGRSEEAVGLAKAGRTIDAATIALLEENQETPAHVAASLGHLEVLRNLIEPQDTQGKGTETRGDKRGKSTGHVSIEAVTLSTGQNLLHSACIGGCLRTVRYLVETYDHFGPEESDADAMACIHHAVARGYTDVVSYLLQRFDSLAVVKDEEFNATLLHWAAGYARLDILKYLLENHIEIGVNVRCSDGSTVLMWAVSSGNVECVSYLLHHRADVYVHDKKGQTCLHIAANMGTLDMVKELVNFGNVGLVGLIDCDGNNAQKVSTNGEVTAYLKSIAGKKK